VPLALQWSEVTCVVGWACEETRRSANPFRFGTGTCLTGVVVMRRPVAVVMSGALLMSVVSVSLAVDNAGQGATFRSIFV
jgi:hypothetical protein